MSVKKFFKYNIKRQSDGSFVVLRMDKSTKKVDILSSHDTYKESEEWLNDYLNPMSQLDALRYLQTLKK